MIQIRVLVGSPVVRTRKVKGIKVKELRYPSTLIMEVESGWRIYDVNKELIIDENKFLEYLKSNYYKFHLFLLKSIPIL